jgi:hypothetical protein
MNEKLYFYTIQYLDCLYEEGLLTDAKTEKLAQFSLELGVVRTSELKTEKLRKPTGFSSHSETIEILSDVLDGEWRGK